MSSTSTGRRGRPRYPGLFTPAEQRVLDALRRGLTYGQAASELGVSYDAVKYHVSNMLSKAEVDNRQELVAFANRRTNPMRVLAGSLVLRIGFAVAATAAVGVLAIGLVLAALSREGDDTPALPDTATPMTTATTPTAATATPTPTLSPIISPTPSTATPFPDRQITTGVSIVDAVIDAVRRKDAAAMAQLIDYQDVACVTEPQGLGAPPACPPGVADGTPVATVTTGGCHGGYAQQDEFESRLPGFLGMLGPIFAASETDGGYALAFVWSSFADGSAAPRYRGLQLNLSANGLTGYRDGCGRSAPSLAAENRDFLIAPPDPPALPADLRTTGIPAIDAVIEDIGTRDLLGVIEATEFRRVECRPYDPVLQPDYPVCAQNVASGTLVDVFRTENCGYPGWAYAEHIAPTLDFVANNDVSIHSVSTVEGESFGYWLVVSYVFADTVHETRALSLSADGHIVALTIPCTSSPSDRLELEQRYTDYILPPPS